MVQVLNTIPSSITGPDLWTTQMEALLLTKECVQGVQSSEKSQTEPDIKFIENITQINT